MVCFGVKGTKKTFPKLRISVKTKKAHCQSRRRLKRPVAWKEFATKKSESKAYCCRSCTNVKLSVSRERKHPSRHCHFWPSEQVKNSLSSPNASIMPVHTLENTPQPNENGKPNISLLPLSPSLPFYPQLRPLPSVFAIEKAGLEKEMEKEKPRPRCYCLSR